MKKARQQRWAQGDFENRLSNDSNTTSPHAPQLFEAFFARRKPCRKCSAIRQYDGEEDRENAERRSFREVFCDGS